MLKSHLALLLCFSSALALMACKERRGLPVLGEDGLEEQAGVREISGTEESKDQATEDEIKRLAGEKELSEQRIADLERTLLEIENKMKPGSSLTDAEKVEYQRQLDQIKKDREAAEAKRLALEEEAKKALAARKRFVIFYDKPEAGATDDCLMYEGDVMADGALLRVKPCDFLVGQQFTLEYTNETDFRLVSKQSSKCVGVTGDSKVADVPLIQQPCSTALGQVFKLIDKGNNQFFFQNVNSQLCMKITADGRLRQNTCQTNSSLLRITMIEST